MLQNAAAVFHITRLQGDEGQCALEYSSSFISLGCRVTRISVPQNITAVFHITRLLGDENRRVPAYNSSISYHSVTG